MKYGIANAKMIDVSKVFLDEENPRHDPHTDQDDAIAYLCKDEQILTMAKDIAKHGLNPLELFAVIKEKGDTYFAAEGNRRLCALKLLNDSDNAPANLRNDFLKAAQGWKPIDKIFAVEFSDRDDVRLWLDRIHAGSDSGRGRRQWNADQKARNSGYSKNNLALAVLDYGEDLDLISSEGRRGRLSTVQRYLGNPIMRDTLGLALNDEDQLTSDLPSDEFKIVFEKFISDIDTKTLTTRKNAAEIVEYAHELRSLDGMTGTRSQRTELSPQANPKLDKAKAPKKPAKKSKISPCDNLQTALSEIPSYKLEQIYYSICSLSLALHTPLLAVGAWTFLETLTALCGREDHCFHSFLSPQKLKTMSVGDGSKNSTKSLREAVKRISELGNTTKHNKTAAAFNGEQLANDFETMENLLVALAVDTKGKS